MGQQYRVFRKVGTMQLVAGGFATLDLPRAYDYESLFLDLNGTAHVTVDGVAVRAEAPCQLVPRIEVIAEGKNTIYSAPMWHACLGRYDRPLTESGARATTPPSGHGVADFAFEAIGVIDFCTIDGLRAKDSNFRTSGLSLFQLRCTFGQPGDIFTGGTVSWTGTPTLDIYTSEMVEGPNPKTGKFTSPIALKKVSSIRLATAASNVNLDQRLPAGNQMKSVLVRTEGNTTALEPSTAQLNNLILQSGLDVRCNIKGASLRAKNNADYGQVQAGYYIADMVNRGGGHGSLSELWDLSGQVEPKVTMDVVGGANNFIDLIVTEYILAQAAP